MKNKYHSSPHYKYIETYSNNHKMSEMRSLSEQLRALKEAYEETIKRGIPPAELEKIKAQIEALERLIGGKKKRRD